MALSISNCFNKEVESKLSYDDFISAQEALKLANRYIEQGESINAIPLLKNSSRILQFARESEISLAEIYFINDLSDSGLVFAGKAFSHGARPDMIKGLGHQKELYKLYNETHHLYEREIDMQLKEELQLMIYNDQYFRQTANYIASDSIKRLQKGIDSVNFNRLRSIILEHGWPGISKLGLESPPMVSVMASHAKKNDLRYFLLSSLEAAEMNKSSWIDVESLMQSYIYNFRYVERARMLEFFELSDKGDLTTNSRLSLNVLAKSLSDNPFFIELICFDIDSNICVNDRLSIIKNTLFSMGLEESRILNNKAGRADCNCITYGFIPFKTKENQYDFDSK